MTHEDIIKLFFRSFCEADFETMSTLLAPGVESYITNAEGGVNRLSGRQELMQSLERMDVKNAKPSIKITQMVPVNRDQVLLMVEIKAARKSLKLHNFAAYLLTFQDGAISTLRMVEALPAFSDKFWSA